MCPRVGAVLDLRIHDGPRLSRAQVAGGELHRSEQGRCPRRYAHLRAVRMGALMGTTSRPPARDGRDGEGPQSTAVLAPVRRGRLSQCEQGRQARHRGVAAARASSPVVRRDCRQRPETRVAVDASQPLQPRWRPARALRGSARVSDAIVLRRTRLRERSDDCRSSEGSTSVG